MSLFAPVRAERVPCDVRWRFGAVSRLLWRKGADANNIP
jgi:hypothetical protein